MDKTHSLPQERHEIEMRTAPNRPSITNFPPLRHAAAGQVLAAGNSTAPQPGRLNDVQRTLQPAFHVFSCVLGTEDEGILYPENTQLF